MAEQDEMKELRDHVEETMKTDGGKAAMDDLEAAIRVAGTMVMVSLKGMDIERMAAYAYVLQDLSAMLEQSDEVLAEMADEERADAGS